MSRSDALAPANAEFVEKIMSKASVQHITDKPIAKLDDLSCMLPRGKYTVEVRQDACERTWHGALLHSLCVGG